MSVRMGWVVLWLLGAWALPAGAQEGDYRLAAGAGSWGTPAGLGLIGVALEVEQGGLAVEGLWGIGTNRVQGWGLWPRAYLAGEGWRPFGELALVQVSETELSVDPQRGLVRETFTWQFMGVGLGVAHVQGARRLRASLGLGVTGGQCAVCALQPYATVHWGVSF